MVTPAQSAQPGDTPGLAGLAREVEELQRTVVELQTLPKRLEDLANVVTRLAETTNTAAGGNRPDESEATSWLDYPGDVDAARAVLADLAGWMAAIYLRYTDAAASLPECWAWHPGVVEELLWLQAAWQVAYRSDAASPALAGDWHDRQRPGVVRRIKTVAGICSIENHQPGGDHHHDAAGVPLPDHLDAIADWWTTNREAAPTAPAVPRQATNGGTIR